MQNEQAENKISQGLVSVINKLLIVIVVLVIGLVSVPFILYYNNLPDKPAEKKQEVVTANEIVKKEVTEWWKAADINNISDPGLKEQVNYGKDLIAHTSKYLGPNGSVLKISNGMNCQNCHLQAGTAVFGNNYGSVASLYPKFRARSGTIENIYKRVNDCFERSLNGKALDTAGKEMQAICSYINFIGSNVEKGKKALGSGFKDLSYLDRAADAENGKIVYATKCQSCHQANGEGVFNADKTEYKYPSLWGPHSFNDGAGLYRISSFARYIKYNMPFGVTHENPQLTDEEAWDAAAFVITQGRPHISTPKDWQDKSIKPVDHPFGPYTDHFSERQHKYGPFKPIVDEQKKREQSTKIK